MDICYMRYRVKVAKTKDVRASTPSASFLSSSLYSVTHMVMGKLLLKVYAMLHWLRRSSYCSCPVAPLVRGSSKVDVNKSFSMTIS